MNDDFVLIYGDLLFGQDAVKNVLHLYNQGKNAAVMGVVPVDKPENYGIIELDEQKKVKRIVEKPAAGKAPSNLANAGVYVFSHDIFEQIKKVKPLTAQRDRTYRRCYIIGKRGQNGFGC